jgi:outer membrane protein OmpA-like peptidoglycan-associated protein
MNMPRKTLGRGLGDLMSEVARVDTPLATASDRGFLQLPPGSIVDPSASPAVPSEALLESIRTHGILQPILARKNETGYEVIDGRQRLAAARALGLKAIPSLILNRPQAGTDVLAAEANRRTTPVPEPLAAPTPLPVSEPSPVPVGWRTDWRLPAAFAAIAVSACLLGMGAAGMIETSSGWTPVSLPASDRAGDSTVHLDGGNTDEETDRPVGPSTVANALTAEPDTEATEPTPRLPPAWAGSLNIDGVQVATDGNTATLTFLDPVFAHHTTLSTQAEKVLRELAKVLAQVESPLTIEVRGHTDDTPVRGGGAYRDNYALGLARAARVVQFLHYDADLTNTALSAASQADVATPFPNDTPANRLKNRTVTLRIAAE